MVSNYRFELLRFHYAQDNAFARYNFNLFVFRLLVARRDARGMYQRRDIIRRSALYGIVCKANGVLGRVRVRASRRAFLNVLLIDRRVEHVDICRDGIRTCLFLHRQDFRVNSTR